MSLANSRDTSDYLDISVTFRAPRVAIVINGDGDWIFWARHAIYVACGIWGGYGFVLVPHKNGIIDPVILRGVRAYDPDYVVNLQTTVGQIDSAHPGHIDALMKGLKTTDLAPEDVASFRDRLAARIAPPSPDDLKARESVAAACSPYKIALGDDADVSKWRERETVVRSDVDNSSFSPVRHIRPNPGPRFGAVSTLNTPLGLLAANLCGLVCAPQIGTPDIKPPDETSFVFLIAGQRTKEWIVPSGSCFEQVDSIEGEDPKSAWEDTLIELGPVTDHAYADNPVLYVIGNEPEDFCLALLWERLYGRSIWIPDELWVDGVSPLAARHRRSLAQGLIDRTQDLHRPERCVLTSASWPHSGSVTLIFCAGSCTYSARCSARRSGARSR